MISDYGCDFQEKEVRQLLLEVRKLEEVVRTREREAPSSVDSPKLAALKLQNSKLQYRITHLQRVCPFLHSVHYY